MTAIDDTIEQIRQGLLYPLLSRCSRQDLAPLVEAILAKPMNDLVTHDDYTAHKPDHTRYHKVIGDELRLFGGHSIANIFRGGEGPPYSEIVVDVCKKLDVPFVKDDTVQNEANLLDIFFERRWQSLDPFEREQLAADARLTATRKVSSLSAVGKTAVAATMARLAIGPAGFALLGNSLLDPSFKLTIPCVLHIAYLRRRMMEEWRENDEKTFVEPETRLPAVQSDALVITTEGEEPVLSLARIPEPSGKGAWRKVGESDDGISQLNPLLSAIPGLAVAGEVARTQYMEVVCNGVLVGAKDQAGNVIDGGFRAFSRAPGGITEQAVLFSPDKLAAMVNVSAVMNVASIALAQKHLADISRKLGEIKGAIDGIRKFQNDQRRSQLTGAIRYFEQVAPSVLEGERPDRVLALIEHHEAELLKVHEHLKEDIRGELDTLRNLKDDEWFGSGRITSAIEMHQQRLLELHRELLLCIRARACGWQLLCVFPGEKIGKAHRRLDIQKSLDLLTADGEMLKESDALLRKKIHEVVPTLINGTTTNDRKLALLKANEMLLTDIATCLAEVQSDLQAADNMLIALKNPVTMTARIENGRITAIQAR